MDVKVVGSNPIYHPDANNKSNNEEAKEEGGIGGM